MRYTVDFWNDNGDGAADDGCLSLTGGQYGCCIIGENISEAIQKVKARFSCLANKGWNAHITPLLKNGRRAIFWSELAKGNHNVEEDQIINL